MKELLHVACKSRRKDIFASHENEFLRSAQTKGGEIPRVHIVDGVSLIIYSKWHFGLCVEHSTLKTWQDEGYKDENIR